jgi:hypothetical protein
VGFAALFFVVLIAGWLAIVSIPRLATAAMNGAIFLVVFSNRHRASSARPLSVDHEWVLVNG